jgi:hypothetical protein
MITQTKAQLQATIDEQARRINELETTLRIYANPYMWTDEDTDTTPARRVFRCEADGWETAKAALVSVCKS